MAYTLYLSFILIRLGLGLFEYGVKKLDLFGAPFHRNCSNFPCFSSVEMDEINKNPSELHSSHVCKELNTNIMDLNKKRKLQAELLDLPLPKHKCCGRSFSSQIVYPLDEDTEIEDLHAQIVKEETNGETIDDGSEPDSAKDSNSLAGYSDSVISVYGEAKFEPECEKTCPYNYPYSSSVNWGGNSSRDDLYSLKSTRMTPDVRKDKMTFFSGEHNPLVSQNLEEQLLEFGNDIDFMCSEYRDGMAEHSTDKELADMPYSSGMKPNNYVLSSGRWSVNQDAQIGTRKPTIDQEFEQYFSMLML